MAKLFNSLTFVTLGLTITVGVSAWEPPQLPAGRRLQYYILHPQGDYVFGYDTGEGSSHAAKSDTTNRVRGRYQYGGTAAPGRLDYSYTGGFAVPGSEVEAGEGAGSFGAKNTFGSAAATTYESGPADASYTFSYDADDHSRQESSDASGNVRGSFAFTAKDGVNRKVDYEAGAERGFIAKGAHLPVAPEAGSAPQASSFNKLGSAPLDVHSGITSNQDGSYRFAYDAGDHSRSESADASGNVRGRFAYVAKDGVERKVDYEAGAEKGFIAKGAHLPVDDVPIPFSPTVAITPVATFKYAQSQSAVPASTAKIDGSSNIDGSYSFSYDADDHSRQESADAAGNVRGHFAFVAKDGVNRKVDYEAGAEKGFIAKGAHLPVAPEAPAVASAPIITPTSYYATKPFTSVSSSDNYENNPADRSYSFSYDAGDHSRQESADAAGNVRGRFAFVARDGVNRKVDYEAGAEKGFIAKGAHLPVAPEAPAVASAPIITPTSYYAPKPFTPVSSSDNYESNPVDGSYSFSYDAGDHSRQESADAAGNVRGRFAFRAKDGVNRKVDYEAGAEKGFVARGDHIPVDSSFGQKTTVGYSAPIPAFPAHVALSGHKASSKAADISSSAPGDGSYSFSYNAEDHSRQESADAAGNVRGHFAFVAKDGVNRKVDYEAGAEKGFIAKGAHLPVAPEAPAVASAPIVTPTTYYATKPFTSVSSSDNYENNPADRSYSFSYDAGDHSRQESADAAGNVRGRFAFVARDGVNRKVDYEAGSEKGFIAKGAHLPIDSSFGQKTSSGYSASVPAVPYIKAEKASSASVTSTGPADASYSFSYDAIDHSREESSDASGNVRGNYRFVAKDGIDRKVDYEAGAEKGFLAKGDHLPAPALVGGAGELAYQYSYETDSSKKTEKSDADGNVFGSYSYVGPDGLTRKVDYRAGGQDGFVPTGEHLQPAAVPATKQSSAFAVSSSSFASSSSNPSSPSVVSAGIFASSHPGGFITTSSSSSTFNPNTKVKPISYSLHTFLPHESPSKFGYVYDTLG